MRNTQRTGSLDLSIRHHWKLLWISLLVLIILSSGIFATLSQTIWKGVSNVVSNIPPQNQPGVVALVTTPTPTSTSNPTPTATTTPTQTPTIAPTPAPTTTPTPTPTSYGIAPPQESYPTISEDYPLVAELPAGMEGKITVVYNYVIEYPQVYLVNIKVVNLSDRTIEKLYYDELLIDSRGNVLNEIRNEGHHNGSSFPLLPGDSVVLKTCRTSVEPGFSSSPISTWKVELVVTYIKFS